MLTEICIAHGRAVGRVTLRRSLREHTDDGLDLARLRQGEIGGEPAGDGGIAQVAHGLRSTGQHGVDARVPHAPVTDLGGGVAQHQTLDTLRRVDRQPLADQATHGQTAEARLGNVQRIQQGQYVAAKLFDAVRAVSDGRATVATGVVAQHAEVFGEGGNLCIPHVQVGAQGVGQHQHRRAGRAFEEVIQVAVGEFYGGHGKLQAESFVR
ncbi:hypothetical protein D9M71_524380 [compost metagenome]